MKIQVHNHTGTGPEHQETFEGTKAEIEIYVRRAYNWLNKEVVTGDLAGCLEALDSTQNLSVEVLQGEEEIQKNEYFLKGHIEEELAKGEAPMKGKAYFADVRAKLARDRLHITSLANQGASGYMFSSTHGNGHKYLVHRNTYPGQEGKWRVTRFNPVWDKVTNDSKPGVLEPSGHSEHSSLEEAIEAAGRYSGDLYNPEIRKSEIEELQKMAGEAWRPEAFNAAGWTTSDGRENDDVMPERDPTSNRAFQSWFQGSKVAHPQTGKPLIAFHGTTKDFDQFQTQRPAPATAQQRKKRSWAGELGTWFAAPSKTPGNYDPGNAEYVAGSFTEDNRHDAPFGSYKEGARVLPVHLSIKHPAEFDGYDDLMDTLDGAYGDKPFPSYAHLRAHLEAKGHDGVVIRNSMTDGNVDRDDWVAFHPHQIKSAIGNAGTYDPANPHIGKAESDNSTNQALDVDSIGQQLGFEFHLSKTLDAAQFLSSKPPISTWEARHQLLKHDDDLELAALSAFGLELTEGNVKALRGLSGAVLAKAEQEPLPVPRDITPAHPDAVEASEEVLRAYKAGTVHLVNLNGKHSKGTSIGYDQQTGHRYMLKPGSGDNSPARGVHDEDASQSRREVAFWHAAELLGLGEFIPRADLLYIDGREVAAIRMLPPSFKNLGNAIQAEPQLVPKVFMPYLRSGILHKWAVMDMVLGQSDRHSMNCMVSEDHRILRLIDHGSALAGKHFDPGHDENSFIPFYLRAFSGLKFSQMDPAQQLRQMPTAGIDGEKALSRWIREIDSKALAAKLQGYGIDPEPEVTRLELIKSLPGKKDNLINSLWLGIGIE